MEYGSRQVKWYWLLAFTVFCGFSVYRLFQNNPYLYSHSELRAILTQSGDRPRQTIPAHPVALAKIPPQTYVHRYNLERTAQDPVGGPRSRSYIEVAHPSVKFNLAGFEPTNIVGDRTGFYLSGKSSWVVAIDMDGAIRWRYRFTETTDHPIPAILLDVERAYLIHPSGEVVCLDKLTGALQWVMDLRQDVAATPFFWNRNIMVPVKGGDKLQLLSVRRSEGGVEPTLSRLDAKPGLTLAFGTALEAFIGTVDSKVIAIDPEDWEVLWTQTLTDPIRGPAVINDQQIFVSTLGGKVVRLDGSKKGKIDWEVDLPKAPLSPPAYLPIMQRLAVLDQTGGLNMIDAKSGKALWREPTENKNTLVETWAARLKGRNIEEFKMDWLHKGWSVFSPCSERRLCIYTPGKGQLIERITLSGQPLALPVALERSFAVFALVKPGEYTVSRLVEESELKKSRVSE